MNLKNVSRAALTVAASALAFVAAPASAVILTYNLTGAYSATWNMDSNPATGAYASEIYGGAVSGVGFSVADVNGSFPGHTFTYLSDLYFYAASQGGGMDLVDYYGSGMYLWLGENNGDALYSGLETNPTMLTGTFNLYDLNNPNSLYTLTVSRCTDLCPTAPVPEPSTWMTMILGFGLIGGLMRKRVSLAFRRRRAHA